MEANLRATFSEDAQMRIGKRLHGSQEPKPENRKSDSLNKSQLTLSLGFDAGGVIDEDDDG